MQLHPLISHLEDHFALHHKKPLLLAVVQVQSRAAGKKVRMLQDEESAARIAGVTEFR
jgi:hypothetical protein